MKWKPFSIFSPLQSTESINFFIDHWTYDKISFVPAQLWTFRKPLQKLYFHRFIFCNHLASAIVILIVVILSDFDGNKILQGLQLMDSMYWVPLMCWHPCWTTSQQSVVQEPWWRRVRFSLKNTEEPSHFDFSVQIY